jgi:hypothetical protein
MLIPPSVKMILHIVNSKFLSIVRGLLFLDEVSLVLSLLRVFYP